MRTPLRPLPAAVLVWSRRVRWLRGLDAVAAWAVAWGATLAAWPAADRGSLAVLAAVLVPIAAAVPPLRRRWRPVTALTAVALSHSLRPGSAAWHLQGDGAELVVVTARRGLRLVIVRPRGDATEGVSVRRTRALLLPAERP